MEGIAEPNVSVVISTLNRRASLERCIEAFRSMTTARHWELVIIYQDETDGTREYLSTLLEKPLPRVRLKKAFEPKLGLATARNTGWRIAKGGIVAFTDDDCYVSKDYLDSLVQVFEDDPEIGFLTGRLLLFDASDYKITIQESLQPRNFRAGEFIAAGSVHGANMAFRRRVLEQIGGFDESLGSGTCFPSEDIDAAAAAVWSGVSGVYDPRPVIYHHHGRKTECEAESLRAGYDAGRGAYYTKYILRGPARAQYVNAWVKSIAKDFLAAVPSGRAPQKSLRELKAGLHFAVKQLARIQCTR